MLARRLRAAAPISPKPPMNIAHVAGSGTGPCKETLSSSATGGIPFGVPIDRNDRTCEVLVAVKLWVTEYQPLKP